MARAPLLIDAKKVYADGSILQLKLWDLKPPDRVPGSAHGLKYSLFYGRESLRILAYDNEAGKGDHVHRGEVETPYRFTTYEKLLDDFLTEVGTLRGGHL
ncbi:DUF6516 family protein [Methylobacterium sp. J-077]|uniref:toxin-antitoxin system TumE family protein n=1 Tax=Methylobacterium sp. J-077 TaxID=2836656 RepID=UPI001FB97F38|nr:DUF6516 family protein [Methylobacterium sp. J-077]MCJ2125442.1 DUF6516 family protein [Methylobacterium sp. J-077]